MGSSRCRERRLAFLAARGGWLPPFDLLLQALDLSFQFQVAVLGCLQLAAQKQTRRLCAGWECGGGGK